MARITRSGIAYDLTISPHELTVDYGKETLTYIFSSELYKNKFAEKMESNRKSINESLSNRFGFSISNDILADLKLYIRTERRGFLIRGKEDFTCLSNIKLDGKNLIQPSLVD